MKIHKFLSPKTTLRLMFLWPPFLFSGIGVREFDLDKGYIKARLKSSFWNKNYFGTHYGGSLSSMSDPYYAFILLHHLKKEFVIWDKGLKMEFIAATDQPVYATFEIPLEEIERIRQEAIEKGKIEPLFDLSIVDGEGKLVATVERRLYVKYKGG